MDQKWLDDGPLKTSEYIWQRLKSDSCHFLEILFKSNKLISGFRGFLIILLQNISFPNSFLKALTIFLAIYQSQSKHSRLAIQKTVFKKKTLWPFSTDGVQLSQGGSHYGRKFNCQH